MDQQIRWEQRLHNFGKALSLLDDAIVLIGQRELSRLEKQGAIHIFVFSFELGCNTLKDFLVWQGIDSIAGRRDTIREAFSKNLVADGQGWMNMLLGRNRTAHTYNEETADAILDIIRRCHHPLLKDLKSTMVERTQPLHD